MRGTAALFNENDQKLRESLMEPYVERYVAPWRIEDPDRYFPAKPVLLEMRDKLSAPRGDEELYFAATEVLMRSYWLSNRGDPENRKAAALIFAANVHSDFLNRLGHRHQPALVMMAFWCVLMHRVPFFGWYENAKAKEILGVIEALLTPDNLALISWPIRQVEGDETGWDCRTDQESSHPAS